MLRKVTGGIQVAITGFGDETPTSATLDHLAPERRAGGPPTVEGDIYSFGRILQEIRLAVPLDSPLSAAWDAAAHRCLNPSPAQRFHSLKSVLEAIGLSGATASFSGIAPESQVTKKWGDFQLLQRLGQGGFGEVYRAWDPMLEREVALKFLLHRGLNPDQEYATIISEARAIARVRHPNIVSVYGIDRREGRFGFWSDFVRGQTLAHIVATSGPLSSAEVAEIGTALCDALTAVHQGGLLHRDIKASNAMRDENGRVLLMDFGLSHELQHGIGSVGTPEYMAPELLAGGTPSVQTDVYAMGVLLLFLCTGQYLLGKLPNKPELRMNGKISLTLQQVIRTATNFDPRQRYLSAAKMREALTAALAGTAAAIIRRKKRVVCRRNAWIIGGVALCAGVLLVPQGRKLARARLAGASPAVYQDFLAAEEALQRYDKPGNTERAIALYKQTLQRSPNFALAEAGLARADWRMYLDTSDTKWVDAANEASARAAAINSNLAPVQMTLGIIHVEQGKSGLGMQELEQARQLDPKNADVRAALGEAYRQQGRMTDAKTELQTAMDLAPENWRWPYLLGALQIDSGDFVSAETSLRTALEKTPDNARILYDLGLVYRKLDRLEEARSVFEQALKLDARIDTVMALGTVLTLQGRYDDALEMYKRAVEMSPGDWEAWENLGEARRWTGSDPGEAARDLTKAIELAQQQMKATPDDSFLVSSVGS
ncbi:MAG TPA: tetratricopeptide repeat protein, partial [Candidatus Eremiobacteraceae bacterium]|nr:tetratricopeptide repeat protein [Candidatus Eremiobacteraceae bacterium]